MEFFTVTPLTEEDTEDEDDPDDADFEPDSGVTSGRTGNKTYHTFNDSGQSLEWRRF